MYTNRLIDYNNDYYNRLILIDYKIKCWKLRSRNRAEWEKFIRKGRPALDCSVI